MSRSALWRQEGNVKERERRAEELFEKACEEGRSRSKSTISQWGPDNGMFHFNPVLLQNTIQSPYFQKCCAELMDWTAIIDEIYYKVNHLQVFQLAKQPSTAFCLLLRLLCLRMTPHELEQTLYHGDSPFIRAIGFLFLRYGGCCPEQVWSWIQPHLHDDVEFSVEPPGKLRASNVTMGEYVRKLFQERDYYGSTPLPRYPMQVENDLKVKLLAADNIAERALHHFRNEERMKYFQTLGSRIKALYEDNDNPVAWYEGVVDRVIMRSEDGSRTLKYPKFVVTFTEYGNTETVTLGEMDITAESELYLNNANQGRNRNYDTKQSASYSSRHQLSQQPQDLLAEVQRKEREKVATSDKGAWARRPASTKQNLATRTSHSVGNDPQNIRPKESLFSADRVDVRQSSPPVARKRTAEELAVVAERKKRLLSKYG